MRERDVSDRRITSARQYLDGRIRSLILDLTLPHGGEHLLDIGCGTGDNLRLFHQKGCVVSGIDSSPSNLDEIRKRLENRAALHLGDPEELPFSDDEFDLVTMIASLEHMKDPALAIAEAIRVCRGRIFIGLMNRYSMIGIQGLLSALFSVQPDAKARYFHISALSGMIRQNLPGVRIGWGSVIFLPWGFYEAAAKLEEQIPVMKNPFGAFIGISFSVTFSFITIQDVIRKPVVITPGGEPAHGAVRKAGEKGFSTLYGETKNGS
jgi:SAM-dependent methyltransferase